MTDEQLAEYEYLLRAIQTGVATEHELGSTDGRPKHLRMGVMSALTSGGALVRLLVSKGVFTEAEHGSFLIEILREELAIYEARLTEKLGSPVKLA